MVSKRKWLLLPIIVITVALVFGLMPGLLWAFPEDGKVGQNVDEPHPDGTVTRVEFDEIEIGGTTWYLVMPYRGDFGGDPYLNDGWVMNIYTDRQGNFVLYVMVHESDPRWSDDLEPMWGSWAMFQEVEAGRP